MAARTALNISAPAIDMERGPKFAISLPEGAGVLSEPMQQIARQYLSARHKSGQAFLDACRWLSDARQEAKHGEWQIFLGATNTSAATAKRMLDTHTTAMRDQQFAEAVRNDWIGATMAGALAQPSITDETRADLLGREEPPKISDIPKVAHKTTRMVDLDQPMLPNMPAPAAPADLPPEFAIVQRRFRAHNIELLSNMQGHHRAFVTRKEGMTGVVTFAWEDVLSKLARLEAEPPPKESDVAFRMTCPTCGEKILNGIWGELNECGSCYHARQRPTEPAPAPPAGWVCDQCGVIVTDMRKPMNPICSTCVIQRQAARPPAVPPRPRRPVSADISAQVAYYIGQLEAYASALEGYIMALQKKIV